MVIVLFVTLRENRQPAVGVRKLDDDCGCGGSREAGRDLTRGPIDAAAEAVLLLVSQRPEGRGAAHTTEMEADVF